MANIVVTRIGAILQRLDLPCSALGLPAPPAAADLKMQPNGSGWTVTVSCSPNDADAVTAWLHSAGAAHVERGTPWDPLLLRARFPRPPAPCRQILRECRLEQVSVSPDGTASVTVRGAEDAVARLAHTLGSGPVRDDEGDMPPLTARQAELLQYCVARGYYSIPRRASLRRLSGELGISTTSLSIALRRAEGKIILAHAAKLRMASPVAAVAGLPIPIPPVRASRPPPFLPPAAASPPAKA